MNTMVLLLPMEQIQWPTHRQLFLTCFSILKPIAITGSQIPISFSKTDAKRNIADAIRFACEETGGVYVVFDGRVIQGTRAIKLRTKVMMHLKALTIHTWRLSMIIRWNIQNRLALVKKS